MSLHAKDYTKHPGTIATINTLVKTQHFSKKELQKLFSNVKVQKSALYAYLPPNKRPMIQDKRTQAKKINPDYSITNMVLGKDMQD